VVVVVGYLVADGRDVRCSAALRDFWLQLEMGYEFAEAVSLLGNLAGEASRALNPA
jgi:hypothetical protein